MKNSLSTGGNLQKALGYLLEDLPRMLRLGLILLGFFIATVVLPALVHVSGLPVRWILPMHLPVIIAGIIYGWRIGMIVGLGAPLINWLLTGFPLVPVLPAMMIELSIYGCITGWLSNKSSWRMSFAIGTALIVGRIGFLVTIVFTSGYSGAFGNYVVAAMTPGIAAMFGQMLLIPLVFKWLRSK